MAREQGIHDDSSSLVTRQLRGTFQLLEHLAEYHIEQVRAICRAVLGDELVILMKWVGSTTQKAHGNPCRVLGPMLLSY